MTSLPTAVRAALTALAAHALRTTLTDNAQQKDRLAAAQSRITAEENLTDVWLVEAALPELEAAEHDPTWLPEAIGPEHAAVLQPFVSQLLAL